MKKIGLVLVMGAALVGCSGGGGGGSDGGNGGGSGSTSSGGGSDGGGSGGSTATITIKGMTFAPTNLTVASPSTITVVNEDSFPHTATSEAAAKDYTKGQATGGFTFDTGDIAAGASATITVPAGLASGTVQPYFCAVHKSGMSDPDPTITIQ